MLQLLWIQEGVIQQSQTRKIRTKKQTSVRTYHTDHGNLHKGKNPKAGFNESAVEEGTVEGTAPLNAIKRIHSSEPEATEVPDRLGTTRCPARTVLAPGP